ncbi:putative barnase/colicin E5 family endoribonuclease [Helicobacter pylori]|uniref:putative barnase/colicin E5 family endoribonuclease n=1 Tax=Helicobacter pylori TaxID=210 RepID=UPI003570B8B9
MQAENTDIDLKNLPSTPLYPLKNPILTPEQLEQKRKDLIVDLNQKSKELTELGLLDKLGGFVGYQTENAKEREIQLTDLKTQALDNQLDFKDLPSVLKDDYYNKAETSLLNPLKTKNEIAKEDYQKDLQRKAILNKTSKELTESDKELISDDSGFLNNALDVITDKSEAEKLKEYKEKEKAKDITKEIQKAYSAFSNIDKNKDFFSLFTSEDKEAQEKAKQDFETIAINLYHFDGVIYNEKNEPFVIKGDKVYKINDGFIDNFTQSLLNNKFSLSGSVAGGITGAKYGKNAGMLGLVGGAIAGAALGASAGAASDAIVTNLALDRENKADEIIRHALSEGALSLATDTLILGASKVLKPLAKAPLKLAEMSMPFQFTKNFFTGNTKRASEIIENTLSKEQQQALKEFSAQFGGETKINAENRKDFLRDKIKSVFKGDENKLKAYDKVKEILTLDNHKEQQQAFIRAIRSDETGNTLAFLIEAANLSPKANANLKSILNQTTENLTKSLKQFDLKDYEIKSVFDHLEQGTKESYDKALNEIIGKLYDDSYKVNLRESVQDLTGFEKFLNDLKAQGEIDVQAKSFLRQIEENVYNPNGVTYEQLKNSRQLINAYLRNVKDPSTLGYIQKASANFLKNDIDNAIESLLKQNKSAYEKISELQKSAISDYRDMKQALELVDKAKIRDKNTQESDAINSLMKIIQGQGQKDLTNYQALTKGLQESDKERLELSMLNRLMEQSLKQDESLKVFDSAQFFNKLNEFKSDVFTTPKAKEYIDIASGFHKLFKNDAKIAESLKPAITKNLSQGLATTLSGALKYQWTKFTLGTLYRNAPDRILGVKLPKALNEATAGAALKYHIKRALERSHSISDFTKNLELSAKNSQFTNNTLKIIEELNNGVKSASEEIKEKATKTSNLVKSIREQDTRPFEVIEDKEAFFKDLNQNLKDNATPLPKGMSVEEFKQSLESVENKDRFLEHLETRDNSQDRLKFLSLIEPILREPHIEIFIKDKDGAVKKEYIKAFKDENKTHLYMLITQDNDTILRTFIPKLNERYMRSHVRDADIIHSFIQPNRTAKSDNALSDVVVYGENPTQKPLTSQEDLLKTQENPLKTQDLSPLEQANAEKLAKLESEQEQSEQEFLKAKEQEKQRKEALKRKLEHERGNAGNIESATKIEVGEDIPTQMQAQIPKSRVRLNEREIYDLNYAIVKAKDLKPSFTTGGTQKRTDMNEEQIKSIAENFDPKKIFGSGGFEDIPIILQDGQVIAGNHRIAGMLNFTPKSRFAYEKAIKEYYNIDLKPDELLVRLPSKRLNNTEINNLAAGSNQGRFNSESDHAIAVLSHYEAKLKELEKQLNADSIYSLKNIVAKNLNFDKATHPNVGDSNLALLMFNMPRTKTQGIELLNRWHKVFSNDIKSYEKVKKMFVDNAGSFHNLIHDMNFPNVSLNAYLSNIMDRSFANLKNYQTTSESLKDLSEKFYKTSSLDMFEKSDQSTSDISEILGSAFARFARFDDPSKALFEALKSDNIKKGLKEFKIADVTKDMFDPNSKEFKDIDIYDFTHYLLMVNREPNENNPVLNRLIQAVKDRQKESEKGIKEASKTSAEETQKAIKQKFETPSEWGPNYSEFKNDGLGAINKLLETKKGFVAGAFHKEGLGDIDLVWGNKDYGLEHILKRRESDAIDKGMSKEEAKKYALEIINNIPNIISDGKLSKDDLGRLKIEFKNQRVGLNDSWKGETLNNRWVITSYELNQSSRDGLIESPLAPNYKGKDTKPLNLDNSNPTTKKLNKD